ncbi:MAG TPA: Pvc16 family protein [Anaeromyxobacter sp.]|nr:Pvc16 family protein [Anaeromyxobacter sp.]
MATTSAISTIGQALLALLEKACPRPEFDGATFSLYQAKDFQHPMAEGISLFLYRVTPSTTRRNVAPPPAPPGFRYRPPLPLDLYYLLTPWAPSATRQHLLLAWAMRTLEDTPTLAPGFLNHYGPPGTFRTDESITTVLEPLSLQDSFNLWEIVSPALQVCATFAVRLVQIDSTVEDPQGARVQTRVARVGEVQGA